MLTRIALFLVAACATAASALWWWSPVLIAEGARRAAADLGLSVEVRVARPGLTGIELYEAVLKSDGAQMRVAEVEVRWQLLELIATRRLQGFTIGAVELVLPDRGTDAPSAGPASASTSALSPDLMPSAWMPLIPASEIEIKSFATRAGGSPVTGHMQVSPAGLQAMMTLMGRTVEVHLSADNSFGVAIDAATALTGTLLIQPEGLEIRGDVEANLAALAPNLVAGSLQAQFEASTVDGSAWQIQLAPNSQLRGHVSPDGAAPIAFEAAPAGTFRYVDGQLLASDPVAVKLSADTGSARLHLHELRVNAQRLETRAQLDISEPYDAHLEADIRYEIATSDLTVASGAQLSVLHLDTESVALGRTTITSTTESYVTAGADGDWTLAPTGLALRTSETRPAEDLLPLDLGEFHWQCTVAGSLTEANGIRADLAGPAHLGEIGFDLKVTGSPEQWQADFHARGFNARNNPAAGIAAWLFPTLSVKSGTAELVGQVVATASSTPEISATLTGRDLTFDYYRLPGGIGSLQLQAQGAADNPVIGPIQVDDASWDTATPLREIAASISPSPLDTLVSTVRVQLATLGGRVSMDCPALDLSAIAGQCDVSADRLDLAAIAALDTSGALTATGALSGRFKAMMAADHTSADGTLATDSVGTLRYAAEGDLLAYAESQGYGILLQALGDFRYSELAADVRLHADGALRMEARLKGANPDLEAGRAVHLNLNLGFEEFWKYLLFTQGLTEALELQLRSLQ